MKQVQTAFIALLFLLSCLMAIHTVSFALDPCTMGVTQDGRALPD